MCQDREGFGLAVAGPESLLEHLGRRVGSEEEDGRLGEGPLEMDVADLASARTQALARGLLGALDEPGVGGEVLDAREAVNVVDLVEDRQGEDLADAGQGPEMEETAGVVFLDRSDDVQLEFANEPVEDLDEGEVRLDALADAGIVELLGDPVCAFRPS